MRFLNSNFSFNKPVSPICGGGGEPPKKQSITRFKKRIIQLAYFIIS